MPEGIMTIYCTLYVRTSLNTDDTAIEYQFYTNVVPSVGDELVLMLPTLRTFRVKRRRMAVHMASPVGRLDTAELWGDEIHNS